MQIAPNEAAELSSGSDRPRQEAYRRALSLENHKTLGFDGKCAELFRCRAAQKKNKKTHETQINVRLLAF